jgi:hypothetical protein
MYLRYVTRAMKLLVVFTITLNLGCGEEQGPLPTGLDLEVIITKKGKPLGAAEVNFTPVEGTAKDAIYAQADGQGKAIIVSAKPVEYKVSVSRMAAGGADPAFEKYGEATPLRANAAEKKSFTFDLE